MQLSWEGLGGILANLGGLGGSFWQIWEGLGVIFGSFWRSWRLLKASWSVLGSSWAVLKVSWTVLEGSGELLGGLGSVLATSWEPSWRLWGAILGVSGGSWTRKKHIKGEKIHVKRPSHLDFNFGVIFDRFWIVFLTPGDLILLKNW